MQTNFDFLAQTDCFKDFAMQAAEAERSIAISPSTAAILSRRALELAVRWVYVHDDALTMPYRDNISSLIHEYSFRKLIQPKLFDMLKNTMQRYFRYAVFSSSENGLITVMVKTI